MTNTDDQDLLPEYVFNNLRRFFYMKTGNALSERKRYLVLYRMGNLVGPGREYASFRELCRIVTDNPDGPDAERVITLLTTHFSFFFREPDHFDFLKELLVRHGTRFDGLRLWSAACSTGEEPYSMGITALNTLGNDALTRIRILGTDISADAVKKARAGIYGASALIGKMEPQLITRYFRSLPDQRYQIGDSLRSIVKIGEMNLLTPFPFSKRFHVIFLRNVLYYLGHEEREQLMGKLKGVLVDGGYLVLGHMDTVPSGIPGMTTRGRNIFKKTS